MTVDSEIPLGARVEALARPRPRSSAVGRFVAAVRRVFLPELAIERTALRSLVSALRVHDGDEDPSELLEAARVELRRNVAACEARLAAGVTIGIEHFDGLARTHALLVRAESLGAAKDVRDRARGARSLSYLFTDVTRPGPSPTVAVLSPRREIEVQLAKAVVRAALEEIRVPARRRRLLEAAKRTLLDLEAADPDTRRAVLPHRSLVMREIVRIDRARAAGVDEHATLVHQARSAHARRDVDGLVAALATMHNHATTSGRKDVEVPVAKALGLLRRAEDVESVSTRRKHEARSFGDTYGTSALDALREAFVVESDQQAREGDRAPVPARVDELALARMIRTMLGVTGTLEVGAGDRLAMTETTVGRVRVVRHPEQTMLVEHSDSVEDLPNAFIGDPRTVLHDLASGRLLARRFARRESVREIAPTRTAEIRFLLLDGSSSMVVEEVEARAQVRDALVLTELSEVMRRHTAAPGRSRVVLFYRYFNANVGPIHKIADAPSAIRAMRRIVTESQRGDTDIEGALVRCFEDLRAAVDEDRELASAQIVLVTDGISRIDEARLEAARNSIPELPVRVSVIALGQENVILQRIVAKQRAAGGLTFYQFLDDEEIRAIVKADDRGASPYLFDRDAIEEFATSEGSRLREEIGELLAELDAIERATEVGRLDDARLDEEAFAIAAMEVDFLPGPSISGVLAHDEMIERDARALEARFDRWFPSRTTERTSALRTSDDEHAEIVLHAIAEIVELIGGHRLARRADAIEMLERMLPESDLDPIRYGRVIDGPSPQLVQVLDDLRRVVRGEGR